MLWRVRAWFLALGHWVDSVFYQFVQTPLHAGAVDDSTINIVVVIIIIIIYAVDSCRSERVAEEWSGQTCSSLRRKKPWIYIDQQHVVTAVGPFACMSTVHVCAIQSQLLRTR